MRHMGQRANSKSETHIWAGLERHVVMNSRTYLLLHADFLLRSWPALAVTISWFKFDRDRYVVWHCHAQAVPPTGANHSTACCRGTAISTAHCRVATTTWSGGISADVPNAQSKNMAWREIVIAVISTTYCLHPRHGFVPNTSQTHKKLYRIIMSPMLYLLSRISDYYDDTITCSMRPFLFPGSIECIYIVIN
jgi:hypothetical protein